MAENRKVLLRLEDLKMHFPLKKSHMFQRERRAVKAVDGVSLDIYQGETLGLVGESGCGKSTLGRVILQLYKQTGGSVRYMETTLDDYGPEYSRKTASEIARLHTTDANKLVDEHIDSVKLAGGLLAHTNRSAVSSALREKYEAAAQQFAAAEKEKVLKLKLDAAKEENDSATASKLEPQCAQAQAETERLRSIKDEKSRAVEKLRDECKKEKDFAKLEAYVDHSVDLSRLSGEEMRVLRSDLQMVFQDPYASLNPRLTVGQLISEGLVAHNMFKRGTKQIEDYTLDIMDKCGLQAYMLHRYPHQFSGGQRQRIGIARSLALTPKFVVCDEAVSALDVSIQSQIINLLMDLKEDHNLTYLFISHDLSAVKFISDRIGVMYLGNIIELGSSDTIFSDTLHPYTEALLDAIPTTEDEAHRELQVIEGDIPSPINPPSGCKFHTRCKYAKENCKTDAPEWRQWRTGHYVACHYPLKPSDR